MGSSKRGFGHRRSCHLWKHFGAKEVFWKHFGAKGSSDSRLGFGQNVGLGTLSRTSVWTGGPVGFGRQGTPSFGRI